MRFSSDKAAIRSRLAAERRALDVDVRHVADQAISRSLSSALESIVTSGDTVAGHVPFGSEPGGDLPSVLRALSVEVLLPVVRADLDLDWAVFAGPGSLRASGRGPLEPVGPTSGVAALAGAAAVVVPALAVDRVGVRLGRGGGSYDRALARVPVGVPVIALLFDGEFVDRLPAEPHDRVVTAVVTPTLGFVRLQPPEWTGPGGMSHD